MKKYYYDAKTLEEATKKALEELNLNEEDVIVNIIEEKSSLLKKNIKIEVISINDVISYIKDVINSIMSYMNIDVNLEIRRRDNSISIKLFSDNNAILIGKNGRTIAALQLLIRQMVTNQTNSHISIILDVENYKEKKMKNIEYLAKKVAKEVSKTKVEVKLDSMNSYERRIVHSVLTDNKYVYTESVGEEPNRAVVIKPRD